MWSSLRNCMLNIWTVPFRWTFWCTIRGSYPDNSMAPSALLARRLILLNWKSDCPPSFDRWIYEVRRFFRIEKNKIHAVGIHHEPDVVLQPFISYVEYWTMPLISHLIKDIALDLQTTLWTGVFDCFILFNLISIYITCTNVTELPLKMFLGKQIIW